MMTWRSWRFVVILNVRSRAAHVVDEARQELFAQKQRSYDAIPPTHAALREHTKCAAYQAGIIWGQATEANQELPSPAEWGWCQNGDAWKVCWTTLPPIAEICQELTKCSCKKLCNRRCKCTRSGLTCTALCSCTCQQ